MPRTFPEPTTPQPSRTAVLIGYLDFFRETAIDKVSGLDAGEARGSRLPSGWSPMELLNHLQQVERRWLEWGFLGQDIGDPFTDTRDDRWFVVEDLTPAELFESLRDQGRITSTIIAAHELTEVGRPSLRWDGAPPPTLERICFHLLQEYARHVGQLDVVRELIDGSVGE